MSTKISELSNASVTAFRAKTFYEYNITDFGVSTTSDDNTDAYTAAFTQILANSGTRPCFVYFPQGIYKGNIKLPTLDANTPKMLKLFSEISPYPRFGTIAGFPLNTEGVILEGVPATGSSVIGTVAAAFTRIFLQLDGLQIRTVDNPTQNGIDLYWFTIADLQNIFVNTGVYNVSAVEPTNGGQGIITPKIDNGAYSYLRNVTVCGYYDGIEVNEHCFGDNITLASNYNCLAFRNANHSSYFSRVNAMHSPRILTGVDGFHRTVIQQLNIERAISGSLPAQSQWMLREYDVYDTNNYLYGDVNWHSVLASSGVDDSFTLNGGTNLNTRLIGSV